jgi:hypothetical protein
MTPRRRLLSACGAGLALVGLTACEQPVPIVTVQSGRTVVTGEAQSWCFGGRPGAECRGDARTARPIPVEVTPGQLVAIDVAKEVAERGWFVQQAVPGSPEQTGSYPVRDDHYFTLTMPPAVVQLTVHALEGGEDQDPDPNRSTGTWTFVLTPKD